MRRMMTVVMLVAGLAAPCAAEAPKRGEIIAFLGELHSLPIIRRDFERMGFAGENLDVALEQMERVLRDPKIAGYLADRLMGLGTGELASANLAAGLIEPLLDRGLTHLGPRELGYFYKVEEAVLDGMPRRDCGLAFRDRLSPQVLAERTTRVAAKLNTPALREYYRIQLKAARLGLTRSRRTLSKGEAERAQMRLLEAVEAEATRRGDARLMMQALEGFDGLGNGAACDVGRFFLDAVMAMPKRERHEVLIFMSGL